MKIELGVFRRLSIFLLLLVIDFVSAKAQIRENSTIPIVDLGPDGNVCDNEPRLLNAFNVGCTYEWKFNDSIISDSSYIYASKAGTYSVKVISPDSLEAFDTIKLKLVLSPVFGINGARLAGRYTAMFEVVPQLPGCTYSWDFKDPTSSSNSSQLASTSHSFNVFPRYITVTVTSVITGCSKTDTFWDISNLFESVKYTSASFFNVNIFPNPITTSSKISFTIKNTTSSVTLKAYDLLGREQFVFFENQTFLQGENSIDLSSYFQKAESTISLLKLTIDDIIITSKIINPR